MLAEIASGNVDTADVFFLIATILAVAAAVIYALATRPVSTSDTAVRRVNTAVWAPVLVALSIACVAFAWLQL
jgi:hypothetical protein